MTPAIWQDLLTRMQNLRGDMVGQWQGDLANRNMEIAIMQYGSAIEAWRQARPATDATQALADQKTAADVHTAP